MLSESRAIEGYLVEQYGKSDSLYPRDPKKRAKVNQMLYFDIGTLYGRVGDYIFTVYREQRKDMGKFASMEEALSIFDSMMNGQRWVAGDNITIADYTMAVSVTTAEIAGMDIAKYPNVKQWFDNSKKAISAYEEYFNNGAKIFKEHFDKAAEKLKK
ncbi:glutathione S-transferase 1-1-like [Bacillus rossius redtenbacheri]|uniref:glutathione S-transferase 1-1-like n=1 Tax=Bacillus rossius redtenbacheri TaxID=93214 RepID=UPI002FDE48EA